MASDEKKVSTLYSALPEELGGKPDQPVAAALSRVLPYPTGTTTLPDEIINNRIRYKTVFLDNNNVTKVAPPTNSSQPRAPLQTPQTPQTAARNPGGGKVQLQNQRPRAKKCGRPNKNKLTLPAKERKFALYEPLHVLWTQYATRLKEDSGGGGFADRVLRMDLHGALVTVVRARDPTLVGHCGIVVAETANTLVIVTRADRALTIPKNVSVVALSFADVKIEVFLPALAFRASERSARKIKKKHSPFI